MIPSFALLSHMVFEEVDQTAKSHVLGENQRRPPLLNIIDYLQHTDYLERAKKCTVVRELGKPTFSPRSHATHAPQQTISSRVVSALAVTRHSSMLRGPRQAARCNGVDPFSMESIVYTRVRGEIRVRYHGGGEVSFEVDVRASMHGAKAKGGGLRCLHDTRLVHG